MKFTHAAAAAIGGAALFVTGLVIAGPLNPPGGPVASTSKTLTEIEPRTAVGSATTPGDATSVYIISQPGSYYLQGNVDVPSGKVGVRINASNVTLDLSGFRISGLVPGGGGSLGGIIGTNSSSQAGVSVRNGSVLQTGGRGIDLGQAKHCRLEDVSVRGCVGMGVWVGDHSHLYRLTIDSNAVGSPAAVALAASFGSKIVSCNVTNNNGDGIIVNHGVVSGCDASFNTGVGIAGDNGSVISNCTVYGGAQVGILCNSDCVIDTCTVEECTGRGIQATFGALIRNCTAKGNQGGGISCTSGGTVSGCTAAGNYNFGTPANAIGIQVGAGTTVNGCTASFNSASGIAATSVSGEGVSIIGCTARGNNINGISVASDSVVRDNACSGNGVNGFTGSGVYASGSSNRVEHNNCTRSTWGINIDGQRNIVISNSCAANISNYRMGLNNVFGPIVDRTTFTASGMLGNGPVASTVGSTDPFANIAY